MVEKACAMPALPADQLRFFERVINKGRLAHAYLFIGPKGSGKAQLITWLVQRLFCSQPVSPPCGQCTACRAILNGNHAAVHRISPEGQSIKIAQVRQLQKSLMYRQESGTWRVVIIEEADRLTAEASNSLLKLIEEPQPGTLILLLTEERDLILSTIRSRCQEFHFRPPSPETLRELLKKRGAIDDARARLISHLTADLEEALALCQLEWFAELKEVVLQLIEDCIEGRQQAVEQIQDRWLKVAGEREQTERGLDLMLFWYRDLLYMQLGMEEKIVYLDQHERLRQQGMSLPQGKIATAMARILEAKRRLKAHVHPQLLLEQLVLRLQEGS